MCYSFNFGVSFGITCYSLFIFLCWQRWCRAFACEGFHVGVTTNNGVEADFHRNIDISNWNHCERFCARPNQNILASKLPIHQPVQEVQWQCSRVSTKQAKMCRKTLLNTLCVCRGIHFRWSEEHRSKHLWSKKVHRMRPKSTQSILEIMTRQPNVDVITFCHHTCHASILFAVLRLTHSTWENLSPLYRQSPYLNLDSSILSDKALQKMKMKWQ